MEKLNVSRWLLYTFYFLNLVFFSGCTQMTASIKVAQPVANDNHLLKTADREFIPGRVPKAKSSVRLYELSSSVGNADYKLLKKSNSGNYMVYSSVQGQIISED